MKSLIQIGKVFGKKDGTPYIILKVFNGDDVSNPNGYHSLDEIMKHPNDNGENKAIFIGQNVEEYIVSQSDIESGLIEIDGKLTLGCEIRVFLEGDPARVSFIKARK